MPSYVLVADMKVAKEAHGTKAGAVFQPKKASSFLLLASR
jgi:hypothetical protein